MLGLLEVLAGVGGFVVTYGGCKLLSGEWSWPHRPPRRESEQERFRRYQHEVDELVHEVQQRVRRELGKRPPVNASYRRRGFE